MTFCAVHAARVLRPRSLPPPTEPPEESWLSPSKAIFIHSSLSRPAQYQVGPKKERQTDRQKKNPRLVFCHRISSRAARTCYTHSETSTSANTASKRVDEHLRKIPRPVTSIRGIPPTSSWDQSPRFQCQSSQSTIKQSKYGVLLMRGKNILLLFLTSHVPTLLPFFFASRQPAYLLS